MAQLRAESQETRVTQSSSVPWMLLGIRIVVVPGVPRGTEEVVSKKNEVKPNTSVPKSGTLPQSNSLSGATSGSVLDLAPNCSIQHHLGHPRAPLPILPHFVFFCLFFF